MGMQMYVHVCNCMKMHGYAKTFVIHFLGRLKKFMEMQCGVRIKTDIWKPQTGLGIVTDKKETLTGSRIVTDIEPTHEFKDIVEYKDTLFKKVPYK